MTDDALHFTKGLRFTKGHGTENDFVLVPDHDGELQLSPTLVAAICDRRAGIGADGLIRVVRSRCLMDGTPALQADPDAEWFMDYHNADGSASEMCGNGVRVLAAYLLREALVPAGEVIPLGTRDGVKHARAQADDTFAVDMGGWRLAAGELAARDGSDALVVIEGLDGVARPALSFDLGNPHTVVALAGEAELEAADLTRAPVVDPAPGDGTNVELVVPLDVESGVGHLRMRVHERGVGETRSCGTGACAAALAARTWAGDGVPDVWRVDVPGGTLRVSVMGARVELAGPAELVADGVLNPEWLRAVDGRTH